MSERCMICGAALTTGGCPNCLDATHVRLRGPAKEPSVPCQSCALLTTALAERDKEIERLRMALQTLLPGVERVNETSVEAHLATGRFYLNVAGNVTIVEGDVCRDPRRGMVWTSDDIQEIEEKFNAPIRAALKESEG